MMKRHALIALGLVAGLCLTPAAALRVVPPEVDKSGLLTTDETGPEVTIDNALLPSGKSTLLGPGGATVQSYSAATPKTALFHGTLAPWEGDESRLALYRLNESGEREAQIVLTLTEETRILNAVTGEPMNVADIRPEETCYVYTNAIMALSYPAQTGAQLILAGIPADYVVPSYVEVDTVRQGAEGAVILGTDMAMNITLTGDTTVFPFLTRNIVTKEMLQPGHRLLVWHGPVALSYPSQTLATKVMVFPYGYAGYMTLNGDELSVNGEAIPFTDSAKMKVDGETCLLPLRLVAEQLGCEVLWSAADNSVHVSRNGSPLYTISVGADTAQADGNEHWLSRPLTVEQGVSYVALDDVLTLHQLKIETLF